MSRLIAEMVLTKRNDGEVDPGFRPDTYWPESPDREQLLVRIKGSVRRGIARHVIEEKGFTGLTTMLGRESLTPAEMDLWGMNHPELMTGEYLPDLSDNEVEIARLAVGAIMSDPISVRAAKVGDQIQYRIVDEYGTRFTPAFTSSVTPLSLQELINFLDETVHPAEPCPGGLVKCHWHRVVKDGGNGIQAVRYVSLESAYYPELPVAYEEAAAEWLEENNGGLYP